MRYNYRLGLLVGVFGVLGSMLLPAQLRDEVALSRQTAITRAIQQVSPAVAGINVIKLQRSTSPYSLWYNDPFWSNLLPEIYRQVESLGSGLLLSSDGYIVTNAHVVEQAAEIIVTLPGGQRYEVKNYFIDALTDIALLKIDARQLPAARLGDSDNLIIGEWVVALGNPLGLFDVGKQPTATVGIISGLHMDFGHSQQGRVYQDMIQTDASINPGNSGGPLVNAEGAVIGISSFIFTESQYSSGSIGIGFAIPINRVKEVVEELKTKGRVDRSFDTGIYGHTTTRGERDYLGLTANYGLTITMVVEGSPADKAGIKPGDILLEANGKPVSSKPDFIEAVEEDLLKVGDVLNLKIWREGRELNVPLVLGS